mgnify:CR=1 FL=1
MSSVMRFDEWQDSNGVSLLDGSGGSLTVPSGFLPAGSVLQVVRATDQTNRTTTSTSTIDANISVTITPQRDSSDILIIWTTDFNVRNNASENRSRFSITQSDNTELSGAQEANAGERSCLEIPYLAVKR